jgi:hypothetical protein
VYTDANIVMGAELADFFLGKASYWHLGLQRAVGRAIKDLKNWIPRMTIAERPSVSLTEEYIF